MRARTHPSRHLVTYIQPPFSPLRVFCCSSACRATAVSLSVVRQCERVARHAQIKSHHSLFMVSLIRILLCVCAFCCWCPFSSPLCFPSKSFVSLRPPPPPPTVPPLFYAKPFDTSASGTPLPTPAPSRCSSLSFSPFSYRPLALRHGNSCGGASAHLLPPRPSFTERASCTRTPSTLLTNTPLALALFPSFFEICVQLPC